MNDLDDFIEDDFQPEDNFVEDDFIEETPEKSPIEKGTKVLGQFGLGLLEATPSALTYDLAVAPLASKEAQLVKYREGLSDEIEQLLEQKSTGVWNEKDQEFLDNAIEQLKNPERSLENVQTADIGLRSLIEKTTGLNLKPEGLLENIAHWTGFIKDPKKLFELGKTGLNVKDLSKAIAPTGVEALRGAGAGFALDQAEKGNFGPIGTLAAAVAGDISGNIAGFGTRLSKEILTNPKKVLAEVFSKFSSKDEKKLREEILKDFKDAGVQADIGTITDSDLVKWIQSRLAQSGMTGKNLDELKKNITNQIKDEYKKVADSLGEAKLVNNHEAGTVLQDAIKDIRERDLKETRDLYKEALNEAGDTTFVNPKRVVNKIDEIEKSLKPGVLKSGEQSKVLAVVDDLKRDMIDSAGDIFFPNVKDLINNKIALNDIINYEVQGGTKQLLKGLVSELDRTIISAGKEKPRFAKNFIKANRRFSEHAKTFRNKNISQMINKHDVAQLMNSFNTIQGIRDIRKILEKTPEGKKLFDNLGRLKLDQIVGNNMVDSTTQQLKFGTFSKLLEKEKNRDIVRELLPKQSYQNLKRLQKVSGQLAESAQKFFNSSKTGITLEDAGVVAKVLTDLGNLLAGNPWPLIRTGTMIGGARYLTKLISEPEFLRMVEDLVLATQSNNVHAMNQIGSRLAKYVKAYLENQNKSEEKKK